MTKTRCDLRVLVRFDDGTIGGYAVDGITGASRLRDELAAAGQAFSDPDVGVDLEREEDVPPCYRDLFTSMQSAMTEETR